MRKVELLIPLFGGRCARKRSAVSKLLERSLNLVRKVMTMGLSGTLELRWGLCG